MSNEPPKLEPRAVHGGYVIGWGRWVLAGWDADDGWDHDFDEVTPRVVYPDEEAARAAIALRLARA